jgi:hypothetical protein
MKKNEATKKNIKLSTSSLISSSHDLPTENVNYNCKIVIDNLKEKETANRHCFSDNLSLIENKNLLSEAFTEIHTISIDLSVKKKQCTYQLIVIFYSHCK